MKIVVSEIPEEGLDLEFEEPLDPGPYTPLSQAAASLRVDKVETEVLVRGRVDALLELQCSRCLRPFSYEARVDVDVVYHPIDDLKTEERHEIHDDELDMGFYRGDELDLGELVREQVILSVPIKPLCSESCRGICPNCGADLGPDPCRCTPKEIDPRLAVLKKLLDKGKE